MKYVVLFILMPAAFVAHAQPLSVKSKVYAWHAPEAGQEPYKLLEGTTTALQNLDVSSHQLSTGQRLISDYFNADSEKLVIVKAGALTVSFNDEAYTLGPGSVVVFMPGTQFLLENGSAQPVVCYAFQYISKRGVRADDGKRYNDQLVDWDNLEMRVSKKGGRRDFFDRPTSMFERFEMHVTTLNPGLQSHPPHTHEAEEFILVMEGQVEEFIDGEHHRAGPGDLIFLDSNIPHTIKNVGDSPATYFAFQWE